jgi:hypothetical protein
MRTGHSRRRKGKKLTLVESERLKGGLSLKRELGGEESLCKDRDVSKSSCDDRVFTNLTTSYFIIYLRN